MPTIYIKSVENATCEITNFKDVTIVLDPKQRLNYISFDIKNIGEQIVESIEIILPFHHTHISDVKTYAKECTSSVVYNDRFVGLTYKMEEPLKKGDKDYHVKIGFKVTLKKNNNKLILHYYNLSLIENSMSGKIIKSPSICTKTMNLYVVLPKSLKKDNVSVPADPKNEEISDLNSEILTFFTKDEENEDRFDKEMFNKKRFHKIFKWTNKQLSDLDEKLFPAFRNRLICFEFKRNDSFQWRGYECSIGTIIAVSLSIISIILSIISILK